MARICFDNVQLLTEKRTGSRERSGAQTVEWEKGLELSSNDAESTVEAREPERGSSRTSLLEELTLPEIRDTRPSWEVAVLPLGATEPHNLHLPYGTDSFEAYHLGQACCDYANDRGAAVLQLPVLPYGTESNLREFPLAMNLQPTTMFRVLTELVESVEQAGIRKLVLLNSHGGNDLKPFLREIYGRTDVHLFLCNWYQMIQDAADTICDEPEDHAGEMETSLILHFRPDLVRHESDGQLQADLGEKRPLRFEALREGWVGISRPWHLLTTNTGAGNPHAATAEKGKQLTEVIRERIGQFLLELSNSTIDETFPFEA